MTSQLFALEPKYQACRPVGEAISPLGTILVADVTGDEGVVALVEAATRVAVEPWCPVVLLTRSPALDERCEAIIGQFDMAPAVVDVTDTANLLDPEAILTAVRRRPCPTPQRLARYVSRRVGRPNLAEALSECFGRGLDDPHAGPGMSRSTLSRRLLDFPPLKAHDWSGMSRTIAVLLEGDCHLAPSSKRHDIDPRTVRSHIKLYTGLDFSEARERPGWEWVVEAALQHWGYTPAIGAPAAQRRQRVSGEL